MVAAGREGLGAVDSESDRVESVYEDERDIIVPGFFDSAKGSLSEYSGEEEVEGSRRGTG